MWAVNGKKVSQKEVEMIISGLRIQGGNLCQFLPQDKVHDFSRLNSKAERSSGLHCGHLPTFINSRYKRPRNNSTNFAKTDYAKTDNEILPSFCVILKVVECGNVRSSKGSRMVSRILILMARANCAICRPHPDSC